MSGLRISKLYRKDEEQKQTRCSCIWLWICSQLSWIWCLECYLFANVSEVAQHHNAAPSTQMHEGIQPSPQALEVEVAQLPPDQPTEMSS